MSHGPMPLVTPTNRPYWEGTAASELRLQRCDQCGQHFRFNTSWCPACWDNQASCVRASGSGRIVGRTVIHVAPYESMAGRVPYVLALVELDEQVTMMANVVDCDPAQAVVGARVQVTFEERGELKLPQFKLAQHA